MKDLKKEEESSSENLKSEKEETSAESYPFEHFPIELNFEISEFLSKADLVSASNVSKAWHAFFSSNRVWHDKIKNNFDVTDDFLEVVRNKENNLAALICYKRLEVLMSRKDDILFPLIYSAIRGEMDRSQFVDCLMDDANLLKKVPIKDFSIWFVISCFAGCKKIPKAILKIIPINQELFDCIIIPSGNLELVKYSLGLKDLSKVEITSFTEGQAIRSGNLELVKLICNIPAMRKEHPLDIAITTENLILINYFIDNANRFNLIPNLSTLNVAYRIGNSEVINALLDPEKKFNLKPNQATLSHAAISGKLNLVLDLLNNYGLTPDKATLDAAAGAGNLQLVKHLLNSDNKFNLAPDDGTFQMALYSGNLTLVKFFLDKKNNFNFELNNASILEAISLGNIDLIKFLLQFDSSIIPTMENLNEAARLGDLEIVKFFIDVYELQPNNLTLKSAAKSLNVNLVKYLLDQDNKFNLNTEAALEAAPLPQEFIVSRYLLDPENNFQIKTYDFHSKNPIAYCDYLLCQAFRKDSQDSREFCLGQAMLSDPEHYFLFIEYMLENTSGSVRNQLLAMQFLEYSPFPNTQFMLAKAGMDYLVNIDKEIIESLLKKAQEGFELLGKDSLGVEVGTRLKNWHNYYKHNF